MKFISMAALAALVLFSAPAAADLDAIDCSATAFKFTDPAYIVDCERWELPIRTEGATGSTMTDVMSITNGERTIFFTMIDRRIKAPHIYLERRNLQEVFRTVFSEDGIRDWKTVDDRDGYDVAEFSSDISGRDSRCITVQRYTNAMYTGYKRHVVGMGCTVGKLEEVYRILDVIGSGDD